MKFKTLWLLLVVGITQVIQLNADEYVLRWASSGGAWRAMSACMGYANLFSKLGLLNSTSSRFSSISTASGASWFTTQFFYSQNFFDRTIGSSQDELYDFVFEWLEAWIQAQDDPPSTLTCLPFRPVPDLQDTCNLLVSNDFDWVNYLEYMFLATSVTFDDPDFTSRQAGVDNRVFALLETDVNIVTGLAANARVNKVGSSDNTIGYLAPSNVDRVYAVPLAVSYVVDDSDAFFQYAVEEESLPLRVKKGTVNKVFRLKDWEDFHLFPAEEGIIYASGNPGRDSGLFSTPFGGVTPSVLQIAAASSPIGSSFSGLVPSYLAQQYSIDDNEAFAKVLYSADPTYDLAMCTQWPLQCNDQDGQFLDGGFLDAPTLGMTVAQYHKSNNANLSETMKVILTYNTFYSDTNVKFLSYFSAPFNAGIAPGDFLWAPGTLAGDVAQPSPLRSIQIFQEELNDELLAQAFETIPNSNLTTAVLTGTTIENRAYGVRSGQTVEIFLVRLNTNIPALLLGASQTRQWQTAMAELAQEIASNDVLGARIENFLAMSS